MNKYEDLKEEILKLKNKGLNFLKILSKNEEKGIPIEIIKDYEIWYTQALNVIKQIIPERLEDFQKLYRNEKRKTTDFNTYVMTDVLRGLALTKADTNTVVYCLILNQEKILESCLSKFDSKIFDIQNILRADVFDSELDSARYLLKNGFLRASGAICGVILEKHLNKVCDDHGLKITKKDPSLATYNDALKENVYDTLEWRRMQRLGDLRNLCDHNKQKEPTKEEVEELIAGTDRVIKTIF